jgi:hypothetical protein
MLKHDIIRNCKLKWKKFRKPRKDLRSIVKLSMGLAMEQQELIDWLIVVVILLFSSSRAATK